METALSIAADKGRNSAERHWSVPVQEVPQVELLKGVSPAGCLLSLEARWLLSSGLPDKMRQTWQLLFNSNVHGQSFSTFMGRAGE